MQTLYKVYDTGAYDDCNGANFLFEASSIVIARIFDLHPEALERIQSTKYCVLFFGGLKRVGCTRITVIAPNPRTRSLINTSKP